MVALAAGDRIILSNETVTNWMTTPFKANELLLVPSGMRLEFGVANSPGT